MSRTCAFCGNPVADSNPVNDCGRHRRTAMPMTPGGQRYIAMGSNPANESPASLAPKLAVEHSEAIPADSLQVSGFPFFTRSQRDAYIHWRKTGDASTRPSPATVMAFFPVRTCAVSTTDLRDFDRRIVGIVDDFSGDVLEIEDRLDNECSENHDVFLTSQGRRFVVSRHEDTSCQIVLVDDKTIRDTLRVPA